MTRAHATRGDCRPAPHGPLSSRRGVGALASGEFASDGAHLLPPTERRGGTGPCQRSRVPAPGTETGVLFAPPCVAARRATKPLRQMLSALCLGPWQPDPDPCSGSSEGIRDITRKIETTCCLSGSSDGRCFLNLFDKEQRCGEGSVFWGDGRGFSAAGLDEL